ncbi:hypothetical protein, partial [Pseudomonas sp. GM80]|uniref:hypothetical protein n=1 Tax=Pseudomonas sp. GM80 TaxID=1144339 RepID=UPI001EE65201
SRSRAAAELTLILRVVRLRREFHVGAAEGCDRLILLLVLKDQRQKIAAFGSSYRGGVFKSVVKLGNLPTRFSGCPSDVGSLGSGCR